MRIRRSRSGATLFALLTIVAILGLLSAMLFPALLKLRLAAQQMRCGNNLHQIGLGVHNHIAANVDRFPSTGIGAPDKDKPGTGSWCFQILPFMEENEAFKANGDGKAVKAYYSPTRRPAELYNKLPKSDYAANAGTSADPLKPKEDDGVITAKGLVINDLANSDGTSNVLLVAPKSLRTNEYLTGKGKGDDGSCWSPATLDTLRSGKEDPLRDEDKDHETRFGAPTEKQMNILMCDGAVRRWKYNKMGFGSLVSRNDRQTPEFD